MTFEDRVTPLSYAVRVPVLARYTGQLCLVLGILSLAPLLLSLLVDETYLTPRYLLLTLVLGVAGGLLSRVRAPHPIQSNEAMVITALMFLVMPLLTSYPMTGAGLPFLDALFEGVSAVTTTGLSTLATVEDKPLSFLFSRAWMQWYGGLGIVVLTLALLMGPGATARRIAHIQIDSEDMVGSAHTHARKAFVVYSLLTGLGIGMVWLSGVPLFEALLHTLSAVSTGGFSSHDDSLAGLGGWGQQMTLTLVALLGAIPLLLYYRAVTDSWYGLVSNIQTRALLLAALVTTLALLLSLGLSGQMPWREALRMAPLLAFSAQTTTGFTPLVIGDLDAGSKLMLILSMLVGGGLGSTAGGIKILRLLILLRLLQLLIERTRLPDHAVVEARLAGSRLQGPDIERALLIILLFILVIVLSWLPFLFLGYDPLNALFEVVSACATVGLSSGVTRAELEPLLKGILCFDMLAGRLEIVALLVVLYPATWFGKRIS